MQLWGFFSPKNAGFNRCSFLGCGVAAVQRQFLPQVLSDRAERWSLTALCVRKRSSSGAVSAVSGSARLVVLFGDVRKEIYFVIFLVFFPLSAPKGKGKLQEPVSTRWHWNRAWWPDPCAVTPPALCLRWADCSFFTGLKMQFVRSRSTGYFGGEVMKTFQFVFPKAFQRSRVSAGGRPLWCSGEVVTSFEVRISGPSGK